MLRKLLATALSFAAFAATAVELDGKSQIVLPDSPNVQEEYAAGELASYLGKALDAKIATV
ncbi:MAG: hypothetical protein J5833_06270, partial [Victivallales bacterium]|nr:hypothetical protein [Victivallales bacterium]